MGNDVAEYCKRCDVCQRVNSRLGIVKAELHPITVTDVWKQIGIDLIGMTVVMNNWRASEASETHSGVKINEIVHVGRYQRVR